MSRTSCSKRARELEPAPRLRYSNTLGFTDMDGSRFGTNHSAYTVGYLVR